ncbi:MAG: flagellar biosynthetic protein FliO [Christensenellales bacterium]
MEKLWTTFFYIVVMAAVLVAAYFATKFLAQRGRRLSSRHIRLKDSIMVGRDKYLAIVEAGDKTLLIGITNQSIDVLADIDPGALEETAPESSEPVAGGFAKRTATFFDRMKSAPADPARARAERKQARRQRPVDDEDFLSKMDEAIKRRKDREFGQSGRDE